MIHRYYCSTEIADVSIPLSHTATLVVRLVVASDSALLMAYKYTAKIGSSSRMRRLCLDVSVIVDGAKCNHYSSTYTFQQSFRAT
jgi:hypothetical protein